MSKSLLKALWCLSILITTASPVGFSAPNEVSAPKVLLDLGVSATALEQDDWNKGNPLCWNTHSIASIPTYLENVPKGTLVVLNGYGLLQFKDVFFKGEGCENSYATITSSLSKMKKKELESKLEVEPTRPSELPVLANQLRKKGIDVVILIENDYKKDKTFLKRLQKVGYSTDNIKNSPELTTILETSVSKPNAILFVDMAHRTGSILNAFVKKNKIPILSIHMLENQSLPGSGVILSSAEKKQAEDRIQALADEVSQKGSKKTNSNVF